MKTKASNTTFPKNKINILLLEGVHPVAIKLLKDHGYSSVEAIKSTLSEDELVHKTKNIHILGIRSKTQVTSRVIENADKMLAIGAFCAGTNQISLKSAINGGMAVFNSPYSNTRSVAEMVIGLSMVLMRRIPEKNAVAHQGIWDKGSEGSMEVRGKTMGIIGYGHIGSQVSVLAEGLGMKVVFYDLEPRLSLGNAASMPSLDQLLKVSDVISIHVPGGRDNKNMFDASRLKKMKKGSILINLSRGDVVDVNALRDAILSKHIGGAGIDVYDKEPDGSTGTFTSPLQGLRNVVLTPHIGGSTVEAQENIGIDVASKLINFLETGTTTGSLTVPAINLPFQNDVHRVLHIHKNIPGVLSEINGILSTLKINILGQSLKTNSEIGYVLLDVDKKISAVALKDLKNIEGTIRTRVLY